MVKLSEDSKLEDCPKVQSCYAPLCPLGTETESVDWFSDEPICTMFPHLDFIRMQRRLQRKKVEGYFNIEMLVIMKQPSDGIDPDSRETPGGWINKRK